MSAHSFERIRELVSEQGVNVVQITALWGEARLAQPAAPEYALIAVPTMLYLAGRLSAVVYAEMPVAVGSQVRSQRPRTTPLERFKNLIFKERRKAALLGYRLPDLGLFWRGEETDEDALALARYFAAALAEEFPDAEELLVQHFHLELPRLVEHLSTLPLMHAEATKRDQSG